MDRGSTSAQYETNGRFCGVCTGMRSFAIEDLLRVLSFNQGHAVGESKVLRFERRLSIGPTRLISEFENRRIRKSRRFISRLSELALGQIFIRSLKFSERILLDPISLATYTQYYYFKLSVRNVR
jgi:hypothetical protein